MLGLQTRSIEKARSLKKANTIYEQYAQKTEYCKRQV